MTLNELIEQLIYLERQIDIGNGDDIEVWSSHRGRGISFVPNKVKILPTNRGTWIVSIELE
jgi:hypothetical protein